MMFSCNDLDQVGVMLWDKHKKNEDQDQPTKEECILITFGECSKKQRDEDPSNSMTSMVETSGAKCDFLNCNIEKSSANSCLDCNDSSLQMDPWSDLTYLSSVLNDDFNDGSHEDSVVNELMNDLADASILSPGLGIMTRYNESSKLCSVSAGDAMELDGETELFGDDDNGKDGFLNDDWANIQDLDYLHKIFINNDSFDRNEEIHSANSFHKTSADITSSSFLSIAVPDLQRSVEQTFDTGFPFDQLGEHSDANVNSLPEKKADVQSQTSRSQEEEEGKGISFQALDLSNSSEKQPMSSSDMQSSIENPSHIIQSPPLGQSSFNHGAIFSDHEYLTPLTQACVESNQLKPKNGDFKAKFHRSNNHKISKNAEAAVPKSTIMTPREKIEKLKRRKKMQAILQKQCENHGHQIFSTDECVSQECLSKNLTQDSVPSINTMEEHKQKPLTPKVSYLEEQYRSHEMPFSISGRSLEVAVYNQLQCVMRKLDLKVRLNIRDSLFRLARSAKERLNANDRRSSDKKEDEYEISMDGESKNYNRYFSISESERVTNLIDRSVADLLFHDSSASYSLPIGDGNVAMAACM